MVAAVTAACRRGVTARVLLTGLPTLLRCAGRRPKGGHPVVAVEDGAIVLRRDSHAPRERRAWKPPAVTLRRQPEAAPAASWALPLPQREEPLVLQHAGQSIRQAVPLPEPAHAVAPGPSPLARNRSLGPVRNGMVAQLEDWLHGAVGRLGGLFAIGRGQAPGAQPRRTPKRVPPPVPAIARANREINALRDENARLKLQVEALEVARRVGRGGPSGVPRPAMFEAAGPA